jgi:hypothetical protein
MAGNLDVAFDSMHKTCSGHWVAALSKKTLQFGGYLFIRAGGNIGANVLDLACQKRSIPASAKPGYSEILRKAGGYLQCVCANRACAAKERENFHRYLPEKADILALSTQVGDVSLASIRKPASGENRMLTEPVRIQTSSL